MVFLVFLTAFIIRIIVQYNLGTFVAPEVWEYETAVNNFFAGRGLVHDIYGTMYYSLLTPLYSTICIVVYFLSNHNFFVMAIVQAAISSFTCVVIFWIGKHIFGEKVGLIAAFLTVLHPGFIIYATKFHPFILDSFLFCLIAWLLIVTRKNPSYINQFKLGISFGLEMLTRSTILLFLPFSWLWLRKTTKKFFPIFILTSFILVCPWIIRNYIIHKKIMIVSSSANVFWRGNNPYATGTSLAASGRPMLAEAKEIRFLIEGKSEMEQHRIFWEKAFEFIRNSPSRFVKLTLKKFYYFWWFSPTSGGEYNREWFFIYKIFYVLILTFGVLGILRKGKIVLSLQSDAVMLILLMMTIAIAQSFFYVEGRHRWAIEPLLLIFTANGIANLLPQGLLKIKK